MVFDSKSLMHAICACVRNMLINVTFVNEKLKFAPFSLFFYNTIQLFYCFISFHMRHSQNTFINMFNINAKNDISFSIMLNKRSI